MKLIEKFKNWFTSSKIEELEKKIMEIQKGQQVASEVEPIRPVVASLIKKCIYNVGTKNIDVVFTDGDVISAVVESNIYEQIRNTSSKEDVLRLLTPNNVKGSDYDIDKNDEKFIKEQITPIVDILSDVQDFKVVNTDVFLKDVNSISIPSSIVAEFIRIVSLMDENRQREYGLEYISKDADLSEEYNSLLMFTYKLLLNPMKSSREDCLEYVKKYDIKLTNTGNMIMYRRIVSVDESNKDLIDFVSKQYVKVKSWKKAVKHFTVYKNEDDQYGLTDNVASKSFQDKNNEVIGNLAELYSSLSEMKENRYTDDYTRSYDIRIGEAYKIREEDIDVNKHGSCGGALHVADGKVFNYRSFGDTPVAVLVDPRHVYKMDSGHSGKIGVKQMFIMSITEQDEDGNYIDIDSQAVVNFDELYHNQTIDELQEAFKNKSFEPISVSTEVTELSLKEVVNITEVLKNRIVEIA